MAEPLGTAIKAPPDFPVAWKNPGEQRLFWTREDMHFPAQEKPLFDLFARCHDHGFTSALHRYELPLKCYHLRRINTYVYSSVEPMSLSEEALKEQGQKAERALSKATARLMEMWSEELLPELEQHLAHFAAFDLAGADTSALRAHLQDAVRRTERIWEIHFTVMIPTLLSLSLFGEFYRETFEEEGTFASYKLTQGFTNKTLQVNRELWRLGRLAKRSPSVMRVLDAPDPKSALWRHDADNEVAAFRQALEAFLQASGERLDQIVFWAPSWIEDPSTALKSIRDFACSDKEDPEQERYRLEREREDAVEAARQRLSGYPAAVRDEFEYLLKAAQEGTILSEEHAHYIDHAATYQMRRILLEAGVRLAALGIIADRDEIFMLTQEEIESALEAPGELRAEIAVRMKGRQRELDLFADVAAPPVLGTEPPGPPPQDPISVAIGKFFGAPAPASDSPASVRGQAGSPGKARGIVKIVHDLSQAAKLSPGDVLVAPTTMPPWTPLFRTAAAVVTDTGGILSHCAVVAREYGIPAVVGTGRATHVLHDGQLVEVDGLRGEVLVLDPARS